MGASHSRPAPGPRQRASEEPLSAAGADPAPAPAAAGGGRPGPRLQLRGAAGLDSPPADDDLAAAAAPPGTEDELAPPAPGSAAGQPQPQLQAEPQPQLQPAAAEEYIPLLGSADSDGDGGQQQQGSADWDEDEYGGGQSSGGSSGEGEEYEPSEQQLAAAGWRGRLWGALRAASGASGGAFACSGQLEGSWPEVEVDGVGRLALPLSEEQARALAAVAQQAPYGLGTQTLVDPGVRRTLQVGLPWALLRLPLPLAAFGTVSAPCLWLQQAEQTPASEHCAGAALQ
jgi:hypothetical protein